MLNSLIANIKRKFHENFCILMYFETNKYRVLSYLFIFARLLFSFETFFFKLSIKILNFNLACQTNIYTLIFKRKFHK